MTMGDPLRLGPPASPGDVTGFVNTTGGPIGGGGSFVTELHLLTSGATLNVVSNGVIPEPTSIVVWLLGLVASVGFFRRRR